MGLDNGIEIRRRDDLPLCTSIFDEEWRKRNSYNLEVAYWRKCWNVRSIIFNILQRGDDNDSDIEITREEVLEIIKQLKRINRRNFYDMGSCFWEWDEFKIFNRRNICNLTKLARMMKKHPEIVPYFYDSY
jgi:hypothetical protein